MKIKLLSSLLLFGCSSIQAAWWVEPNSLALRADIQLLADTGIILQPVTTYPLMWDGLKQDMDKTNKSKLNDHQLSAFERIITAYNKDHRKVSTKVGLAVASDTTRFNGFGQDYRDKAETFISAEVTQDWFSGRLSASYHDDPIDGNSTRLDNSFAAVMLGNWIVSAGAQQKYWGPGWDTGLIQTTNARPMPGITFSRNNSQSFETPMLNWIGPWTFTTSFSEMESGRAVPNAKHWGARGTLRPISKLEVGFSWTMQWGGEGYGNSLDDWWDGLFNGGEDESTLENGQENMLAGYDFRWSDTAFGIPYGIYYERIHEDYHNGKHKLINASNMGGIDFVLSKLNTRIFIEYADTKAACGASSQVYNCMYEHGFYRSGYRYYGKSLGSTYDNDSETLVIGGITQLGGEQHITNKFRWLRLNTDASDTASTEGGNPLSRGEYERVYQFDTSYHRPFYEGTLKVGGTLGYSQYIYNGGNDWDTTVYAGWERSF
ncbi:capsule assembly Wzi family protein [Shewanella sp. VB17]|uniref:capsule assembly Wzi family protein n=1 Tax=Shewanella sp. VB17 TaxID=2739432 RepID=UPI001564D651|nr:capsule assembly Wzi family protein [Shewanella sp. VB17]NRD74657.1 capsule assembly Wzi family protein [Shewanella sp. VB17]